MPGLIPEVLHELVRGQVFLAHVEDSIINPIIIRVNLQIQGVGSDVCLNAKTAVPTLMPAARMVYLRPDDSRGVQQEA